MLRILFIWCALLFGDSYAVVPLEEFFAFGGENGDERLSQQYTYRINDLKPRFKIFGEKRDFVYVAANGYVMFENGEINVMRGWVDLSKVGDVYWRKSRSRVDLDKAQAEIRFAFPAYQAIDLKWVLIATWYQVLQKVNIWFDVSPEKPFARNSFQFILTTDGIRSFAIFYYNNIECIAGFEIKKYDVRYAATTYVHFIHGSRSCDMLTIGNRSNVGSPGKWIYRIDQDTIYEPNSLCAMPPQPENGICIAEELTRGSLARCNCTHGCKMYKEEFLLECTAPAENETVDWTGNMPECRPLNETTTECRTRFSCQCPTRPSCQCPSCESPVDLPSSTNSSVNLCPFPPIPQNGVCDKGNYSPGSSAKCECLPNFRNINPNSQLYCVFAEDGNLFWSGGMPVCVNISFSDINNP
ncbi:nidogen-like domain-containing protein [Ditylenchus destructor]|uniref:Nidogen-like domain-containing protein n=1 Tax=Ditylenchus destructor TaxID=166010 RepID=A0AAD4MQH1_9BILA|nr:nidogen-like domain-containing protein [Ditylenchus destructor]